MRSAGKVIFIVSQHVPHYRVAVYSQLMLSSEYTFVLLADNVSHCEALQVARSASIYGWNWMPVASRSWTLFGKRAVFQWGIFRPIVSMLPQAVIFEGDAGFVTTWLGSMFCRLIGIKTLQWGMGVRREEAGLKWFVRKTFYRLFNAHLLYGERAANWFAQSGFESTNIWVIRNSLDYRSQYAARMQVIANHAERIALHFDSPSDPYIVYSGRLTKRKRIDLLIDALHKLTLEGRKLNLLLVGDGPARESLVQLVCSYGLCGAVVFYGECYNELEIAKIYLNARFSVCPGAVGLMVMHSFAYGLPILTHDNASMEHGPEFEAVVDGVTGRLFRENDCEDLARKICMMLDEDVNAMSKECIDTVEREFTPQYQVSIVHKALNKMLKS